MSPVNGRTVNGYRSLLTPIDFFPAGSVSGSPVKTAPFYQLTGTHKATVDSYTVVGCGRLAAGNKVNGWPSLLARGDVPLRKPTTSRPSDHRLLASLPAAAAAAASRGRDRWPRRSKPFHAPWLAGGRGQSGWPAFPSRPVTGQAASSDQVRAFFPANRATGKGRLSGASSVETRSLLPGNRYPRCACRFIHGSGLWPAGGRERNERPSFPSQQGRLVLPRARCQQAEPAGSDQRACSPLPAAAYRRATGSGKLAFHRPVAGYPRSAEPVADGRGGMSRLPAASRRRGRGSGRAR